jgi:ubiquitin-conjugating enzyme E2 D/E
MMHWQVLLMGPEASPYEGGVFNIDLSFPAEYPFKPPKVKFLTKIYHPNIKTGTGEICADLLNENWGPTMNVEYVLRVLKTLLETPNSDTPLEADIGAEFANNKEEFIKKAKKFTAEYAS